MLRRRRKEKPLQASQASTAKFRFCKTHCGLLKIDIMYLLLQVNFVFDNILPSV